MSLIKAGTKVRFARVENKEHVNNRVLIDGVIVERAGDMAMVPDWIDFGGGLLVNLRYVVSMEIYESESKP